MLEHTIVIIRNVEGVKNMDLEKPSTLDEKDPRSIFIRDFVKDSHIDEVFKIEGNVAYTSEGAMIAVYLKDLINV